MRPVTFLSPIAAWALRLLPVVMLYLLFKDYIYKLEFSSVRYLVFFGLTVSSVLMVIGGFMGKHTLSVLSGLFTIVFSVLIMVLGGFKTADFVYGLIFGIVGLYFFANGNKRPRGE